jgi:hypothetical protein
MARTTRIVNGRRGDIGMNTASSPCAVQDLLPLISHGRPGNAEPQELLRLLRRKDGHWQGIWMNTTS